MTTPNKTAEAVERLTEFADEILEAADNVCTDPDGGPDDETFVRFTGERGRELAADLHKVLQALSTAQQSEARVREALGHLERQARETRRDVGTVPASATESRLLAIEATASNALASPAPSRVEPVAWRRASRDPYDPRKAWIYADWPGDGDEWEPLYTTPPDAQDRMAALDEPTRWLLKIVEAAGGKVDATDYPWNPLNAFCDDRGDRETDTFNLANQAGYLRTTHDSDSDTSTAHLTDLGRAALKAEEKG